MTLQQEIIQALGAKPHINAEEEIRRSVDFLKSYLQTYPFLKSLVLGIMADRTQRSRKTVPNGYFRASRRNG